MDALELIDRLCAVTEAQSQIIREQAFFIENSNTVDEATKKHYADLREPVERELDILEYSLRPIHSSGCGKEN